MAEALERWATTTTTNSKNPRGSRRLTMNDILTSLDSNSLPARHQPYRPPDDMGGHGIMEPEFPDDLSTIANDTTTSDSEPRTPERAPKDGKVADDEHKHIHRSDSDDDTQPETPPKSSKIDHRHHNHSKKLDRRNSGGRFCRLVTISAILASILMGAVAIMSLTLYQLRNDAQDAADGSSKKSYWGPDPPTFDYGPLYQGNDEDSSPTASPTDQVDLEEDDNDRDEHDVMKESSIMDWIRLTLLSTASTFYSDPQVYSSLDNSTVPYQVMEWMADDPSIDNYTPQRIVQRFALGVVYWTLKTSSSSLSSSLVPSTRMGGWMAYTDECQWPLSRNTRSLCDESGNATSLYLEDMNFDGSLASEIGLLSHMQLVFLTSNRIQGQIPTEVGLLTGLERFNVPRNEITGTIPTEVGLLENLGILGLGNNMLDGPLPSEIGNMEQLVSLMVQDNELNGTIPEGLWDLSSLTFLHLDNNNFEGSIPEALGNFTELKELSLHGNDLTGDFPVELCGNSMLQMATVDCANVQCTCCQGCDGIDVANKGSQTEEPTDEMSQTVEPIDEVSFTLSPTPSPTPATPAPTPCQDVQTAQSCYEVGNPIDIQMFNCDPTSSDIIALYRTEDLQESGLRNAFFWISACGETECDSVVADGIFFRNDGTAERLESIQWPFEENQYILLMLRIFEPGALEITAESVPFRVAQQCDTDP